MPPEPTTLRDRQRRRTRDDILDAVIAVASEDAPDGPLIELIAAEAGVSRATLYAHFPGGIDDLVGSAYERAADAFLQLVRAHPRSTWQERIFAHAAAMVDMAATGTLGRFYNLTASRYADVTRVQGAGSRASQREFAEALADARAAGHASGFDIEETARLLTAMVRTVGVRAAESRQAGDVSLASFRALVEGLQRG